MYLLAHAIPKLPGEDTDGDVYAWVHPANEGDVWHVLNADESSEDGRSEWVWVRLPNGDLILGVFPQGRTYEDVEQDAAYPGGQ